MTATVRAATLLLTTLACVAPSSGGNLWPPRKYDQGVIAEWNAMLVDAVPISAGNDVPRYYALMHMAMYDAISSIDRKSPALNVRVRAPRHASTDAAAAQAAHDVLVALLPENKLDFDLELKERLATINAERGQLGVEVGREVAQRTLAWAAKRS